MDENMNERLNRNTNEGFFGCLGLVAFISFFSVALIIIMVLTRGVVPS